MRRLPVLLALASLAFGAAGAAQPAPADAVRAHVRIVIFDRFPEAWVAPIQRALEAQLRVQVGGAPERAPLPSDAYYAPRRRYRAERLLPFLAARAAGQPSVRVLGLTGRDISTTNERFYDWGILGLADLGGPAAVVSSFRMRRRARSPEHALWRMTTTAVHEMGHALGLPHCDEARCLMRDANGTMDTVDAGDGALGPACAARIDRTAPARLPRRAP